jgi:hypothetical protein
MADTIKKRLDEKKKAAKADDIELVTFTHDRTGSKMTLKKELAEKMGYTAPKKPSSGSTAS